MNEGINTTTEMEKLYLLSIIIIGIERSHHYGPY